MAVGLEAAIAAVALPFEGLPLGWQVLLAICLAIVVTMFLWTTTLFARARHAANFPPPVPPRGADGFLWVFLVPALNEELTIRDSVQRLLALDLPRRMVMVIDDGSEDRTGEILAEIDDPSLSVLRRDPPHARKGKAAALNNAYRCLSGIEDRERTIVVVVDADGRLHPHAPSYAAGHFENRAVGGVQSRVRIYNRQHLLTWLQDVEFGVYGRLFQAGRDSWGTAGMGGNGQFNRLAALDDLVRDGMGAGGAGPDARAALADLGVDGGGFAVDAGTEVGDPDAVGGNGEAERAGVGPWRDRLTEDQDLGLRLIGQGWEGRQDLRSTVDQQGVPKLRPLLRQRTRWSQGNLQAIRLVGEVWRAPFTLGARIEQTAYLLMPFWQGIVGVGILAAVVLAATGTAPLWGGGPTWQLGVVYVLAFGGTVMGCIASRADSGPRAWLSGLLVAQVYALYTWFLWPVLVRSTVRQLTSRGEWSKTARTPVLDDDPATASEPRPYGDYGGAVAS